MTSSEVILIGCWLVGADEALEVDDDDVLLLFEELALCVSFSFFSAVGGGGGLLGKLELFFDLSSLESTAVVLETSSILFELSSTLGVAVVSADGGLALATEEVSLSGVVVVSVSMLSLLLACAFSWYSLLSDIEESMTLGNWYSRGLYSSETEVRVNRAMFWTTEDERGYDGEEFQQLSDYGR